MKKHDSEPQPKLSVVSALKFKDFRAQLRGVIDKKFFIFRLIKIFG